MTLNKGNMKKVHLFHLLFLSMCIISKNRSPDLSLSFSLSVSLSHMHARTHAHKHIWSQVHPHVLAISSKISCDPLKLQIDPQTIQTEGHNDPLNYRSIRNTAAKPVFQALDPLGLAMVAFSSLWGFWEKVCQFPASKFFFLMWRSARAHLFHPLCQDWSTVAQQAAMTVPECFLMSCMWSHFPEKFPHYPWTA